MPDDTPRWMFPAWLGCMDYVLRTPDLVAEYREETGDLWEPGTTSLERMIDSATGRDQAFIRGFIQWANVKVWGQI